MNNMVDDSCITTQNNRFNHAKCRIFIEACCHLLVSRNMVRAFRNAHLDAVGYFQENETISPPCSLTRSYNLDY